MSRRSASLVAVASLLSAAVGSHAHAASATKLAPKVVLTLPSSGEYPEGIAVDPSSQRI
jgi:hypothetical protein